MFIRKIVFFPVLLLCIFQAKAQELFTVTEPASNMPAHSVGFRQNNTWMRSGDGSDIAYHALPEIMIGVSRKWMMHAEGFFSSRDKSFSYEGFQLYGKYRFFSQDDVHSHFRMALFGRYARNNADVHQEAIDLNGHNTGWESGLIATQLLHKVALSASISYVKAGDNRNQEGYKIKEKESEAVNYTMSVGKLMLPKNYITYRQTNLNLMLELPAQTNLRTGKTFVDAVPIVQLIFLSQLRMDMAYRFPLSNNLDRTYPRGWMLRLEYTIFNVW
jgi:hypothetical protein